MPQQDCKTCGKSTNSCPGCSNACICGKRSTERCGMTCQEAEPLDEYVKCTCNTDCGESQLIDSHCCCRIRRMPRQDCKVCGKSTDSCPGCSNVCICAKRSFYYQQSNCSNDCNIHLCTCAQHGKQSKNYECQKTEHCGMTCQDTEPLNEQVKCNCHTDCGESQITNDGCPRVRKTWGT